MEMIFLNNHEKISSNNSPKEVKEKMNKNRCKHLNIIVTTQILMK